MRRLRQQPSVVSMTDLMIIIPMKRLPGKVTIGTARVGGVLPGKVTIGTRRVRGVVLAGTVG
jgi:hypothetical protein